MDCDLRDLHVHSNSNVTASTRWETFSNDLAFWTYPARRPITTQEPMMAKLNQMMPRSGQPKRFSFHIFACHRPLRRPSQPKQHWDFHQPERRLTTRRAGDIPIRKNGCLNFLYITPSVRFGFPLSYSRRRIFSGIYLGQDLDLPLLGFSVRTEFNYSSRNHKFSTLLNPFESVLLDTPEKQLDTSAVNQSSPVVYSRSKKHTRYCSQTSFTACSLAKDD